MSDPRVLDLGTPVVSSRQWSTALSPRTGEGGGWNFITQSYQYPSSNPTEWIVVHFEGDSAGLANVQIFSDEASIYSNSNFQINNQLRTENGRIWFPERVGNIGVDLGDSGYVNVAYYDPVDEEVHQLPSIEAPLGGESIEINQDAASGVHMPIDIDQNDAMWLASGIMPSAPIYVWPLYETEFNLMTGVVTDVISGAPLGAPALLTLDNPATGFTKHGAMASADNTTQRCTSDLTSFASSSGIVVQMMTIGTNPASGFRSVNCFGESHWAELQLINGSTGAKFQLMANADGSSTNTDQGFYEYPTGTPVIAVTKWDVANNEMVAFIYNVTTHISETISLSSIVTLTAPNPGRINLLGDAGNGTDSVMVYASIWRGSDAEVAWITLAQIAQRYVDGISGAIPTAHAAVYSGIVDPDGTKVWMGTQANGGSNPFIFEVDASTGVVTTHGSVGTVTPSNPRYAYYLSKDVGDYSDYVYVAVGQQGWELIAVNTSDGIATALPIGPDGELATTGPGFQFIQLDNTSVGVRATVYNNNVPSYFWVQGAAVEEWTAWEVPPSGGFRDCTPWNVANPLVDPPVVDYSRGIGQVLWHPFESDVFQQINYDVTYRAPVPIEAMVTLPDRTILGSSEQYQGFFRGQEWFGNWYGGVSSSVMLLLDGLVYISGYPNGVLYIYDPDEPWEADVNPALVDYFHTISGVKYPYHLGHAAILNRLYVAGRRERDAVGSALGCYSIGDGAILEFFYNDLPDFYPVGLAVLESTNLVALSTSVLPDGPEANARIVTFDMDLNLQTAFLVQEGLADTGEIFATGNSEVVVGIISAAPPYLAYRFNVVTGDLLQTVELSSVPVSPVQNTDGSILFMLGEDLVVLDADTLEYETVLSISDVSLLAIKGTTAYVAQGAAMSIVLLPDSAISGGGNGGDPPSVSIVSPDPGVNPGGPGGFPSDPEDAAVTPIVVDITDGDEGLEYIAVFVKFQSLGNHIEVVYRGGQFEGLYADGSTSQVISNGIRLSIKRTGGWYMERGALSALEFIVDAIDSAGNYQLG